MNMLAVQQSEQYKRHRPETTLLYQRLSMTDHGKVRYELKTPYRDGTGNRLVRTSIQH